MLPFLIHDPAHKSQSMVPCEAYVVRCFEPHLTATTALTAIKSTPRIPPNMDRKTVGSDANPQDHPTNPKSKSNHMPHSTLNQVNSPHLPDINHDLIIKTSNELHFATPHTTTTLTIILGSNANSQDYNSYPMPKSDHTSHWNLHEIDNKVTPCSTPKSNSESTDKRRSHHLPLFATIWSPRDRDTSVHSNNHFTTTDYALKMMHLTIHLNPFISHIIELFNKIIIH
eukprot:580522_1